MISFEDFAKVELKTGKVVNAEPLEESEKLLKLMVDIGEDAPRQILAGIKQFYSPDDLIGKTIIVVANLEPRKMMGLESQGMLLAADGEPASPDGGQGGRPIPLTTLENVEPGSKIR